MTAKGKPYRFPLCFSLAKGGRLVYTGKNPTGADSREKGSTCCTVWQGKGRNRIMNLKFNTYFLLKSLDEAPFNPRRGSLRDWKRYRPNGPQLKRKLHPFWRFVLDSLIVLAVSMLLAYLSWLF